MEIPDRPTVVPTDAAQSDGKPVPSRGVQFAANQTTDDIEANRVRNLIVQGRKAEALAAIAGCTDRTLLAGCQAAGLKGDWRRAAVAGRCGALDLDRADPPEDDDEEDDEEGDE
jgi:hypothetical protein